MQNSDVITREYFDSLLIEMRHIDGAVPDTGMNLFGEKFLTPVMTAALSHLNGCHPDGMVELARGAKAAGAVMWSGMSADGTEIERIAATGAKTVKIIKPHADNAEVLREIEQAESCGCIAVGMDVDHAFNGSGTFDTVLGLPMAAKSLAEMKMFVKATKLPFIVKGVLSATDAAKCLEAGASGIVVSHHHGIISCAVPPLMALPKILDVIRGRIPVFVDCGIENGYDVFKALALGAAAVCVGRALMPPLTDGGADGVSAKIREMTAELAELMARICAADLSKIDGSVIWHR